VRTLQAIYQGALDSLLVNGTELPLTDAMLAAPHATLAASLTTLATAAAGFEATVAVVAGKFTLHSASAVTWTGAMLAWMGHASSVATNATTVTGSAPVYVLANQIVSVDLPIATYAREIKYLDPVVWRGPEYQWEFKWRVPYAQVLPFDPRRVPFVVLGTSAAVWAPANRDGWIALRPMAVDSTRRSAGTMPSRVLGEYTFRCAWIGGAL
jgi:hypothetical protein